MDRDVTITTGLVDTSSIPQLVRLISSARLDASFAPPTTSRSGDRTAAYDTFADAANSGALKVVLQGTEVVENTRPEFAAATEPS